MKYRTGFIILVIFCSFPLFSQNQPKEIKNSGKYYWGEGKAASLEVADKYALSDLLSQISVQVESQFRSTIRQSEGIHSEDIESIVRTYSHATICYADRLVAENKGMITVLRYFPRSQVKELFEQRKEWIKGYVSLGKASGQELRIGDALKYYYWSYILLQSLPDCRELTLEPEKQSPLLINYLPDRIHSILSGLSFEILSVNPTSSGKIFNLQVLYEGKPVRNFDYTYWDGENWSTLVGSRTGHAAVELFGASAGSMDRILLAAELKNINESKINPEVWNVLENAILPSFPKATFNIPIPAGIAEKTAFVPKNIRQQDDSLSLYPDIIKKIHQSIGNKDYAGIRNCFTEDGYRDFECLIKYGNAVVLESSIEPEIISFRGELLVRSYPMLFSFRNNQQQFIENVVYSFTGNKISNISFAVSGQTFQDVMSKSEGFGSLEQRYILIRMLEHYKTAYCLKDTDFLDNIFAENAIIIVGKKLVGSQKIEGMYQVSDIEYIRLTKHQFMERLKKSFRNNEFVNLRFDATKIRKGKSEIYGIQLEQHYYSSSYSDKGYLFLMVDLKDTDKPCIYVRTWQPEPHPDGSVYGLEMFDSN